MAKPLILKPRAWYGLWASESRVLPSKAFDFAVQSRAIQQVQKVVHLDDFPAVWGLLPMYADWHGLAEPLRLALWATSAHVHYVEAVVSILQYSPEAWRSTANYRQLLKEKAVDLLSMFVSGFNSAGFTLSVTQQVATAATEEAQASGLFLVLSPTYVWDQHSVSSKLKFSTSKGQAQHRYCLLYTSPSPRD